MCKKLILSDLYKAFFVLFFNALAVLAHAQWEKVTSPSFPFSVTIEKAGAYYFMGADDGMYRSNDTGLTWDKLENFPSQGVVRHLYFYDGVLYATMFPIQSDLQFYVYKSADYGETWTTLPVLNMEYNFENLLELVAIGDTVFVAKGFLYRLLPGSDWEKIPHITGGVVREGNDLYIYYDHVMKSSDYGETFETSSPIPDAVNSQLITMAVKGDTIVGNASFSRILSYDGGETWQTTAGSNHNWRKIVYDNGMFINLGDASVPIEFSLDGANWTPLQGLSNYSGRDMAIAGDTLLIAESGVYRSDDFGGHWKIYSNGMDNKYAIYELGTIGNLLSASGQFFSKDDGITWTSYPLMIEYPMRAAVQRGDSLLLLSEYTGFYKADTSLEYIRLISKDFVPYSFDDEESLVMKGDTFFVCDEHQMVFSTDEGATWQPLANQPEVFTQITLNGNDLYGLGYNSPLWKSSDNGNSWQSPNSFGIENYNSVNLKKLQASEGNLVLVQKHSYPNRVMVSSDNGNSFSGIKLMRDIKVVEDMKAYEDKILIASSEGVFLGFHFGNPTVEITANLPVNYIKSIVANERYILVMDSSRNIWRRPWSSIEFIPEFEVEENQPVMVIKPNPSSGKSWLFPINMSFGNGVVKIYDATGRLYRALDFDANSYYQEINMEGAPVGLYHIVFTNGRQKATVKWMIGL